MFGHAVQEPLGEVGRDQGKPRQYKVFGLLGGGFVDNFGRDHPQEKRYGKSSDDPGQDATVQETPVEGRSLFFFEVMGQSAGYTTGYEDDGNGDDRM
nr:hypothetical protein [Membranihabitans maritimus]